MKRLGIGCRFIRASELSVSGKGSRLLLDICNVVGADTYLTGAFGKEYLDLAEFSSHGVAVQIHEYCYPEYPQRFGTFVPYLSYIDMLFNNGLDREKVSEGNRTPVRI